MAPIEVIDYVVIHELTHLLQMNHSSKFWNIVAKIQPNYNEQKIWLKNNGHLLNL
jgi:predicted metal-dependent hydrolase